MAGHRKNLSHKVARKISEKIASGEYAPGQRIPTEFELAAQMEVSRTTVRAAINELAARGLISTTHGVGSFVTDRPTVHAGLEHLESITDSIRAGGRTPQMKYVSRVRRPILPDEAGNLNLSVDTEVLEFRRTILADNEVMAFSYDLMPIDLLPDDFDEHQLDGSLFRAMETDLGLIPHHSKAGVHAVHSEHVGWGSESRNHHLYVLLDQKHYDVNDRLLLYSRTYFIEGRYEFTIHRTIRT